MLAASGCELIAEFDRNKIPGNERDAGAERPEPDAATADGDEDEDEDAGQP